MSSCPLLGTFPREPLHQAALSKKRVWGPQKKCLSHVCVWISESAQPRKCGCDEIWKLRRRIREGISKMCQSCLCIEAANQGNRQEEWEVLMHEVNCDLVSIAEVCYGGRVCDWNTGGTLQRNHGSSTGLPTPQQACLRGGISRILGKTAKAAATMAAMEPFYTRMEPWSWSQGTWEALTLFRRKARFYS